jgi:threonine synthase
MTSHFYFECSDCNRHYPADAVIYLCPVCSSRNITGEPPYGVLRLVFDYQWIGKGLTGQALFQRLAGDEFLSLRPLQSLDSLPKLRVGKTPCYHFKSDKSELFFKDDSQNPTWSFKDRASALVSAWAKEKGITRLVAASTGNAGSSLAGICASQGQKAIIVVPASAPRAKLIQVLMYGAQLIPVKGTYDDAFDLSIQLSDKYGWYNRNTAYNPLTIDGKKLVAMELFSDLGYRVPDRVFVPTGDGVILSGVYKGFEDLLKLRIIDRMPTLVAVQSEGSPNLVDNLAKDHFQSIPSRTIADSISVDVPRNFRMSKSYFEEYQGEAIKVSDHEIREASVLLSRETGLYAEPASAAAFAGYRKYADNNLLEKGSVNVVLLTGSGLKDPGGAGELLKMPEAILPDIDDITKLIG